jgi:hypothetical protein
MATNFSNDIHIIEDAIKQCESQIERLKSQLKDAEEERQRWERQLALARAKSLDYFNRCPAEIFIEIFQIYLTPEHRNIRSLLLVCKKWHDLVMKTPSLWNRIDLFLPAIPVDRPFRLIPYVQACKQRSENLKLDVVLDLRNLGSKEELHNDLLKRSIKGDCRSCLLNVLSTITENHTDCYTFEQRMEELFNTVQVLVGEDSKDITRWSSLRIALPYFREVLLTLAPAWVSLNGPKMSLLDLSIEGLDRWLYLVSGDEERQFSLFPGPSDWSQVQRLSVYHSDFHWIPVKWSSIKHLYVTIGSGSDLLAVSNLTSLETLRIDVVDPPDLSWYPMAEDLVDYYFPRLHTLSIIGYIPNDWFEAFKFKAPALTDFSIYLCETGRYLNEAFDMAFPQISPRIVTFTDNDAYYDLGRFGNVWDDIEPEKAVQKALSHFSSADQIIFGGFTDELIRKALVEAIQNNQQCPASVYTERKGDFVRLHHAAAIDSS